MRSLLHSFFDPWNPTLVAQDTGRTAATYVLVFTGPVSLGNLSGFLLFVEFDYIPFAYVPLFSSHSLFYEFFLHLPASTGKAPSLPLNQGSHRCPWP